MCYLVKRLRNLRKSYFKMIRKGLMCRRRVNRPPSSLSFLPHSIYRNGIDFNAREYEFSCSNSPNLVHFLVLNKKYRYFPCINLPKVVEGPDYELPGEVVFVPRTPGNVLKSYDSPDRVIGEKCSPVMSPFVVRNSNYSSEDECDEVDDRIDHRAEEFIKRFYEQLRVQH